MKNTKLFNRFVSLMLALVMCLGMLPMSAMGAGIFGGSDHDNSPGGGAGDSAAVSGIKMLGTFARITLLEYNFSDNVVDGSVVIPASQWYTDARNSSGTKGFTNLWTGDFWADGSALNSGSDLSRIKYTGITAIEYRGTTLSLGHDNTAYPLFHNRVTANADRTWPVSSVGVIPDYYTGSGVPGNGRDALLGAFANDTGRVNGVDVNIEYGFPNDVFYEIVGNLTGWNRDTVNKNLFNGSRSSEKTYRVLVEPGVVVQTYDSAAAYNNSTTTKWAFTLRDWAVWSYSVYQRADSSWGEYYEGKNVGGSSGNGATHAMLWYAYYSSFYNLAMGLRTKSTANEFLTYSWDGSQEFSELTADDYHIPNRNNAVWVSEAASSASPLFPDSPNFGPTYKEHVADGGMDYFMAHAFGLENNRFGRASGGRPAHVSYFQDGSEATKHNATKFGAGEYAGFGLGVIAPYMFAGQMAYEPGAGLTLKKTTSGNGTSADCVRLGIDNYEVGQFEITFSNVKGNDGQPWSGWATYELNGVSMGNAKFNIINGFGSVKINLAKDSTVSFKTDGKCFPEVKEGTAADFSYTITELNANQGPVETNIKTVAGETSRDELLSGTTSGVVGASNTTVTFNNGLYRLYVQKSSLDTTSEYTFRISAMSLPSGNGSDRTPVADDYQMYVFMPDGKTTRVEDYSKRQPIKLKNGNSFVVFCGSEKYAMSISEDEANSETSVVPESTWNSASKSSYVVMSEPEHQRLSFANGAGSGDAAHILIDYNFNKSFATGANGLPEAYANCGMFTVGQTVENIGPKLKVGDKVTPLKGGEKIEVASTSDATVYMTYQGLYDNPGGTGQQIGSSYTITKPGLTVLYCVWNYSVEVKKSDEQDKPVLPTESNVYTVYWDQNYIGGGLAAMTAGQFKIWYRYDECVFEKDEDGERQHVDDNYTQLWVTYNWSVPQKPARLGWNFVGWSETASLGHDLLVGVNDAELNALQGSGLGNTWAEYPKDPGKGTTFFGIWQSSYVNWDANGGYFPNAGGIGTDGLPENTQAWQYSSRRPDGLKDFCKWPGWINVSWAVPIIKQFPVREGYIFTGWYFDPACQIPMTESEYGIYPSRTYWAGWEPETVEITYYDTREGTSVVGTQTYSYGEALKVLGNINDTSGQTFNGWVDKNGKPVTTGSLKKDFIVDQHGGMFTIEAREDANGINAEYSFWKLDLYADWTTEYRSFTVQVDVDDLNNNDACRPKTVTFALVDSISGKEVPDTERTLNIGDGQDSYSYTYRAEDKLLPITTVDSSVEKVIYYVYFKSYTDADGVKHEIEDPHATSGEIVGASGSDVDNTVYAKYDYSLNNYMMHGATYAGGISLRHDLITTGDDIAFTIQWADEHNNDGLRPDAVTLTLYANGQPVANNPMHNSGTGLVSVSEGMCKVSENGDAWTYIFEDYQKYNAGRAVEYTVGISNVDGYTKTYTNGGTTSDKIGVIMKHDVELDNVPITIIWDDEQNRDGQRPDDVTITLTAYQWNNWTYRWEDVEVSTATVTGNATALKWFYTFPNMKVRNGGQDIIYKASVTSNLNAHLPAGANEYFWVGNQQEITISHNQNLTTVPVTVQWDDRNNNDSIRPSSIILQLYADGVAVNDSMYTKILEGDMSSNTWTYVFENMPRYKAGDSGKEILYTVEVKEAVKDSIYGTYVSMANGQEEILTRYTASYVDKNNQTVTDLAQSAKPWVQLSHDTDQSTVYVYVDWQDSQNRDGQRPKSVTVDFYKQVDGTETKLTTYTITPDKGGSWSYKVTELPIFENGHEIKYFADISEDVRAELAKSGYTVSTQDAKVILTYHSETGTVSGVVHWDDNNNNDSLRPASVTASLMANGVPAKDENGNLVPSLLLTEDNGWAASWAEMPVYYSDRDGVGKEVVYAIKLSAVDGYEDTYQPATTTLVNPAEIVMTMKHATGLDDVPVTIHWNDKNNQDGVRPGEIKVQLAADGFDLPGKFLTLTAPADSMDSNTWTGKFENMPVYVNGKKVVYTVKAVDTVLNTYTVLTAGTELYLSYNAVMADMEVSFNFDDELNADGTRPTGLYIVLTANGVPLSDSEALHTMDFEVDGNSFVFRSLPVFSEQGKKIEYNVEITLDAQFGGEGYSISRSQNITLSDKAGSINRIVVKLTKAPSLGTEIGHIYWFDGGDRMGKRPSTLGITVKNDAVSNAVDYVIDSKAGEVRDGAGNKVGTVTCSPWDGKEAACWTYEIYDLQQNAVRENGKSYAIRYWAMAKSTGISTFYNTADGEANGLDIALTHKDYESMADKVTQDFRVDISWLDNENAWAYRPDVAGVDINLLANGVVYEQAAAHLTKADAQAGNPNIWTHMFENLPTYLDGNAIQWSAEIVPVDKYTATKRDVDSGSTLVEMAQSIGFNFTVNWADSDDNDNARPDILVLDIFADGQKITEGVILTKHDDGNQWSGWIPNLPVWRRVGTSTAIAYSFAWDASSAKALEDNFYNASATQNGIVIPDAAGWYFLSKHTWGDRDDTGLDEATGRYQWETTLTRSKETRDFQGEIRFDDAGNQDGKRPDSVLVQLVMRTRDEEFVPVGEPVTVTGEDSVWPVSWTGLDRIKAGKDIEYALTVVETPDGYTASNQSNDVIVLSMTPETVSVTGTVNWDDSSELHYVYNAFGDLVRTYAQIQRVDVNVQLLADGNPVGQPVVIPASGYGTGESLYGFAQHTWNDLPRYRDEGVAIKYTMTVASDGLNDLLDDGHEMVYDFSEAYSPAATIAHKLYDVRGTVWYLYDTSDDFLLKNVTVTAYLYDETNKTYTAVGSGQTDENGQYEIRNLPQGMLTVRATYEKDGYPYAGSIGIKLDRHDGEANFIVNRDAGADSDLYRYQASGEAYYQTDKTDPSTRVHVADGSIVLLYSVQPDGVQYAGMTTTENGKYVFKNLAAGSYMVNVVFNYEGGVYTYDNADAIADGLSFVVSGSDIKWPDVIKQINKAIDPDEPDVPGPVDPEEPEKKPEPCILSGNVFYSENGVHTTDPVVNVDVYLYSSENILLAQTKTDSDGAWTADGFGVGSYIAVFSYQASASRVLRFDVTESDFTVGALTLETQYFDRGTQAQTATIRGVVLGDAGQKLGALVKVMDKDGNVIDFMYTDKSGLYGFTVPAGFDYRVVIMEVGETEKVFQAGDPDDELTSLDYYLVSGNFTVDGVAQDSCTVAAYVKNHAGEYELVTATLTDGKGDYTLQLASGGNYQIVTYRNGKIYSTHDVSVGYQEWEPVVTQSGDTFVISGQEAFESLVLYDRTDGVVRTVVEQGAGSSYNLTGLPAGMYDLKLVINGVEKHYYLDAPDDVIDVTYRVTIAGEVLDNAGLPVLGAIVRVYDKSTGKQVGNDTVITNGSYKYANLSEGEYEVRIAYPTAGETLADKRTTESDSYGNAYATGMPAGSVWAWNINAITASGRVTDQTGKPIAGADVILRDTNNSSMAYGAKTDSDGYWTVGVLAGRYEIDAMFEFDAAHVTHATQKQTVDIQADATGIDFIINRYKVNGLVNREVQEGEAPVVPGASIEIIYMDRTVVWQGTADDLGKFEITLWPGDYVITAKTDEIETSLPVNLKSDTEVTLTLGIPMVLSGIVYDIDGVTPVADGIVIYSGSDGIDHKVYTDENGRYEIRLTVGKAGYYNLHAEAAGNSSSVMSVPFFNDKTQDLYLQNSNPERVYTVTGIVTDNDGHRLANAEVVLTYGDDKTRTVQTSTNASGVYRFQVSDGTYYLTASYKHESNYVYDTNAETAIHVLGENLTQNLTIMLNYPVTVTVTEQDGTPAVNVTVTYSGVTTGSAETDDTGKVVIRVPGGEYVFQAALGNRESEAKQSIINMAAEITLTLGSTGLKYEVPDVEAKKKAISGTVYDPDANPVENATVKLYEADQTGDTEKTWVLKETQVTKSDGKYLFQDLEAHLHYKVEVEFEITSTVRTETKFFDIKDYALDDAGNPYVGATVTVRDADENEIESVLTDEDGYYEILNLPEGDYMIFITPADDESGVMIKTHTSEASDNVISGTVLDVNGNPVENAIVTVIGDTGEWDMTTDSTGEYAFHVPGGGEYEVTILYPYERVVDIENYVRDDADHLAVIVFDDRFVISGYVHDIDDNIIEGADVTLLDGERNELADTITDSNGYYEFIDLAPGDYIVKVEWNGFTQEYPITCGDEILVPDEPDVPVVDKITISGSVLTNHKRPLAGAVLTVMDQDSGESHEIRTDSDGRFTTGELDKSRYMIYAEYTHKYGTNRSDTLTFIRSQDDAVFVIILSYETEINGKDETVFAGDDDEFDTPDDFYEVDIGSDGIKDPVYAGPDGQPGTGDDEYHWDIAGEDKPVHVGDDNIPGTPDDFYDYDVDGDGKDEKVYIGPDCVPGTEDDWYWKDVDGDGDDEKVFVGPDTIPGTDDDWYEDDNGDKQLVGIWIRFDANGGQVNGKSVWPVKKSDCKSMPQASQSGYKFLGWFTAATGGSKVVLSDVESVTLNTTFYAQWEKDSSGGGTNPPDGSGGSGGGGGGSGGGGGGSGGGGGGAVTPGGAEFLVKFDSNGGTEVPSQTVVSGEKASKPADPVKRGYDFVGWYLDDKAYDFDQAVKSELTLKAVWEHVGVFELLTTEHIAYIAGFPDGTVQPNANITRAEVAMIFYRLLNDEARAQYKTDKSGFLDVAENAWYTVAISTLSRMEILAGRGNGIFDPSANITRGEFAVIATRFDSRPVETDLKFDDVSETHWAHDAILQAAAKGWVVGYGDGKFGPEDLITRAEVVTLVNRVLKRDSIKSDGMLDDMIRWPDNLTGTWYYEAIQEATNGHDAEYDKTGAERWTDLRETQVGNE